MTFSFEDIKNYTNLDKGELTDSGYNRIRMSPYFNHILIMSIYYDRVWRHRREYHIKYHGKEYPIRFVDYKDLQENERYFIPVGVSESPKQWMKDYYDLSFGDKNIFLYISENKRYFKDLQEGRAYLMIDNSLEGYHDDDIFDYLFNNSAEYRISPSQIIYISGNLNVENNLKEWCKNNEGKIPIQVIPYPHFEFDIGYKVYEMTKDDGEILPTIKNHLDIKKTMNEGVMLYNFLNNKSRPHRLWMFNTLRNWNMLDNGIVAFNKYEHDKLVIDFNETSKKEINECNKLLPIYPLWLYQNENPYEKQPDYYTYNFNVDACLKSWLTVISETHFEDMQRTVFLSEKTFKAIATQTPFFILGNRHSLKHLKNLGYQTFDGLVNENYDDLLSIHRIEAIVDEIRYFQAIENKIRHFEWFSPILRHNLNVLKKNALFEPPSKFCELYNMYKLI